MNRNSFGAMKRQRTGPRYRTPPLQLRRDDSLGLRAQQRGVNGIGVFSNGRRKRPSVREDIPARIGRITVLLA